MLPLKQKEERQSNISMQPDLADSCIKMLDAPSSSRLARIGAQKIRHCILTQKQRDLAWPRLRMHLLNWHEISDPTLFYAMSSALYVGKEDAVPDLQRWILYGVPAIAKSAAAAIWTGEPKAGCLRSVLKEDSCEVLFRTIVLRLKENDVPDILWTLGPLVGEEYLPEVYSLISEAFIRDKGCESAAAVRLTRMLRESWGQDPVDAVVSQFAEIEVKEQFLRLV